MENICNQTHEINYTEVQEESCGINASDISTNKEETMPASLATRLFSKKTLFELCKSSWSPSGDFKEHIQPYLRGCKWSPDGTCCLSIVNNDGVHLLELPRDLYCDDVSEHRSIDILNSVIHVREAGLIYDFCWYPRMNSSHPETCCWLTTRQNAPVQMWDAFDGSLRCSYRGFNAVDEMEPALTVTFSADGSKVVAGYKKVLRTFNTDRPGRDCSEHAINSPAACLAVENNLLAVGSWNTSITLYNISEMGTYKSIGKMHGHSGGVTHIKFTPDGLYLVSGARKDHRLLIWDIRYFKTPINILSRAVNTNQRIYFDISPCGEYLVSGTTDGILKVWDSNCFDWKSGMDRTVLDSDLSNDTFRFPLHNDCCNSVSIHPYRPILATGSGQYHFPDSEDSLESLNEFNNDIVKVEHDESAENDLGHKNVSKHNIENGLVFWWTGVIRELA